MKKHFWKIGAFASVFALFCVMNMWLEAYDFSAAYERTKAAASSAVDKAKSAATSAYDQVKSTATSVIDKAKSAATLAVDSAKGAVTTGIKSLIGFDLPAIRQNPYKDTVATLRIGNTLHPAEHVYRANRKPKVKNALEKMLGRSLSDAQVPTIALVESGGGYRAMLGTIGTLLAAEKMGLLGATTYITALSGGTWAVAPWVSTGMSLAQYKNYIMNTITKTVHVTSVAEAKNIVDMLSVKLVFEQPITMVDVYGGLLGNRLLSHYGNDCQRVYLSQQTERVKNGDIPYPIYTAIDARMDVAREPHWFEFTPHEIGTPAFGVYVPTWGYGRKFNGGKSIDFAPEQPLSLQMGTFGSAFGVHFGRAWDEVVAQIPGTMIKQFVEEKFIDPNFGKRVTTAWLEIFNYMYGMPSQELKDRPTLKFVDAGIDFNLPYPPISGERPERKADIIVLFDFSGGALPEALIKTEAYARRKGLKFPRIDYAGIDKKTISIFRDETDLSVPVVIYMPRISDAQLWQQNKSNPAFSGYSSIEGFDFEKCTNGFMEPCGTSSFQYTKENSQKLIDQMEFNVMVNKDKIIDAIKWVIDKRPSASVAAAPIQ